MRASQFLIATLKESPSDAEVISHQLMLRAGMIRRLASGLYSWLPLGVRVLRKVEAIVRKEMNKAGAQELLMPMVQPAELWAESGRWQEYGPELRRLQDRHQRDFCLGPTHEEVITDIVRSELNSYRQLPVNFYQIQTKFRDEIRPRFGVMRSREFIMKDAYSFHASSESLAQTYQVMYQAYSAIFDRFGLKYRAVLADTGSIGGAHSHEFHVLAESGEDFIAFSDQSDYAANVEMAEAFPTAATREDNKPALEQQSVETSNVHTIEELCDFLDISADQTVKTLIVEGSEPDQVVALVIRGDHQLNAIKASKISGISNPLTMASSDKIQNTIGCDIGSIGPIGLDIPIVLDRSAAELVNFVCGANRDGYHYINANWTTTITKDSIADIRNVVVGDPSPCGKGTLHIKKGIEVGHIFQLGDKYSQAMDACVLNKNGKKVAMSMGCYGIGITRVVAAAIEQNHDERGIIWPDSLAPFQVAIVPVNVHKSAAVREYCEGLYQNLTSKNIEVLYLDEERARLGGMLADVELMGIPHRLVVGDKGLTNQSIEYRHRKDSDNHELSIDAVVTFIEQAIQL